MKSSSNKAITDLERHWVMESVQIVL